MSAAPAPPPAEISWDGAMRLLEALPALPLAERGAQVELLVRNSSPGVRERVLHLGANLLPEERIAEHLRNDHDAVLRNAGLEMLKLRGARSFPLAVRLLADPEPDVVLQAVLLLDHLRDPRALEALRGVLTHPDLNVVQAAILAIGRLGDARSIPDLLPFLAADPWLQMAAVQALGDLRSRRAVSDLARLLGDPVVGGIAAEALARIGGISAGRALIAHWFGQAGQLDDASLLGLLAHVLEGLPRTGALEDRAAIGRSPILAALGERLAAPAPEIRAAAARCVLALGPSDSDEAAVAVLVALAENGEDGDDGGDGDDRAAAGGGTVPQGEAARLPPVLRRRPDLAGALLRQPGTAAAWGMQLAALFPRQVAPADVLAAMALATPAATPAVGVAGAAGAADVPAAAGARGGPPWSPPALAAAVRFLGRVPAAQAPAAMGPAVLRLYLGLPAERRADLVPLLRRFRVALRGVLAAAAPAEIDAVDRVVLGALLGGPGGPGGHPRAVAAALEELPLAGRLSAIVQLAVNRPVMRALPWGAWLRDAPEAYAAAAAEAAAGSRLFELLPLLRALPPRFAGPPLLRAFAELADVDAVPWLLELLEPAAAPSASAASGASASRASAPAAAPASAAAAVPFRPELRPLVLESLGRIGGAAARRALAAAALDRTADSRLAYRALAACAALEDAPLFRAAVTHPDWYVRLACAEVLGRFAAPEDMPLLARLAADPVAAVAHRALSCLEG
ncbi:MAG TPA: HEAT repeat domain-containing protein [Thermoanaerobaculia bacterium]|nr:HEAT repeat domain-containing protein [Thermoanaerobaculia bacterium]